MEKKHFESISNPVKRFTFVNRLSSTQYELYSLSTYIGQGVKFVYACFFDELGQLDQGQYDRVSVKRQISVRCPCPKKI